MGLVECLKKIDFVGLVDKSREYREEQELKAQKNEKLLKEIELEHKVFMDIYREIKANRKEFKEKLELDFSKQYKEVEKKSFVELTEQLNKSRKALSKNLEMIDCSIEFEEIGR